MVTYCCGDKSIRIELDIGIYAFYSESAIGKTYMFNTLFGFRTLNKDIPVCLITYYEGIDEGVIINKLCERKYELVFIDRADLLLTDNIIRVLNELNCIILLDLKYSSDIFSKVSCLDCELEFNSGGFRVCI